ncbi:MAG: NAD(P)H-binding protein [Deltaproteobacteria bacterium]|nr:NAD(P)H-binding protein [Deltaproteobacteria bacterium]
MKVTIFGATGLLGRECLSQCLEAGHEVTVLVRTPSKLPEGLRDRITIIEGDGLDPEAVEKALADGAEGILFAVGVDKHSPEDLCTDVTRNILASMRKHGTRRLVWCSGGNTDEHGDVVSFGSKFVGWFSRTFMALRQRDKVHQTALLRDSLDIEWIGIRPLQMHKGPRRGSYRVGFHRYSGLSKITAADCAEEMIRMLADDTWLHRAPVIQY